MNFVYSSTFSSNSFLRVLIDGYGGSSSSILDPITPRAQKNVTRLWTNLNICEEKC